MSCLNCLNTGVTVLYTEKPGAAPVDGTVCRVTKTQARVSLEDGTQVGPFKRRSASDEHVAIHGTRSVPIPYHSAVYLATEAKRQELQALADRIKQRHEEKRRAEEARQLAILEHQAVELAEAKAVLRDAGITWVKDTMPDGSRIYTVDMPIKPENRRKRTWERLIVHCRDFDDQGERPSVDAKWVYCNDQHSGFGLGLQSGRIYANDEDVVWDMIRDRYHSW